MNSALYEDSIVYHDTVETYPSTWAMQLNSVSLGDEVLSCEGNRCQVVVSTGANDIFGPEADVQRLYEPLNTTRLGGVQLMQCSQV